MTRTVRIAALVGMFAATLGLNATQAAAASITVNFNDSQINGVGAIPYGTVKLDDLGLTGVIEVTVTLNNGNKFVNTGLDGSFAWNLVGDPTISVTGLPAGWTLTSTTAQNNHMDGYGYFDYSVNSPGNGGGAAVSGPIVFRVFAAGITIGSFGQKSTGGGTAAYFAADILAGTGGATGAIGVTDAVIINPNCTNPPCERELPVPEPATLVLLGSGLALAAMRLRRKSA